MKKVIKYKSGLTLIYKRHKNSKESVYFEFKFMGGTNNDPEGMVGLAHFAEHALGLSNSKYTKGEKFELIYKKGECNFETSPNYISGYGYVADEQFEECFCKISNWLTDIDLKSDEVESERKVLVQEIKQKRINIEYALNNIIKKTMYKDFPHNNLPPFSVSGIVEHIEKITLKDLTSYIEKTFCQKNCQLTVCGNVSLAKVKNMVSKYVLPYMPSGEKPNYKKWGEYSVYNSKTSMAKIQSPDGENSQIYVTAICQIPAQDNLYKHAASLLNSDFSLVAHNVFRKKYSLAYQIWAQLGVSNRLEQNKHYIVYDLNIKCDSKNVSKILQVLPEFYSEAQNCLVSDERLKQLQTNLRCKNKLSVIRSNEKLGKLLSSTYFEQGYFDCRAELKKLKKRRKNITVQFTNSLLTKTITQKPYIMIVSNCDDKDLPSYSQLCKQIKKNTKWAEQLNNQQNS